MTQQETLKLAFASMWSGFTSSNFREFYLFDVLTQRWNIEVDEENPDLVICGPFLELSSPVFHALDYAAPRIFLTGECLSGDMTLYDYVIGFDWLDYGDRYLRCPIYASFARSLQLAQHKHEQPDSFFANRPRFANYLVSAPPVRHDVMSSLQQ